MEGYILVVVKGSRIEQIAYTVHLSHAVGLAEDIWPELYPETDDVKVFDLRGNILWQPPRED
jgi:hypothetical protein